MNLRLALVFLGLLVGSAVLGVIVTTQPTSVVLPVLLLAVLALPASFVLARMTLVGFGVGGLFILHALTVIRYSWIEQLGILRLIRVPLAGLMIAVLFIAAGRLVARGAPKAALVPALIFVGWALLTGVFGIDPARTLFYTVWLGTNVLIIGLVMALRPDPQALWDDLLMALLVFGVCVLGLSGLLVVAGFDGAYHHRVMGSVTVTGFQGFFNNPNTLGRQACITAAAAMCIVDRRGTAKTPLWFLPVMLGAALAALGAGSRGALLAYGSGVVAFVYLRARSGGARIRVGQIAAGVAVMSVFVLAASQTEIGQAGLSRLLGTTSSVSTGDEGRILIWKSYLDSVVERPLTGVGYAGLALAEDQVALRTTLQARSAHSAVIAYFATTGIPGSLLFGWLVLCVVRGLRSPQGRPFARSYLLFLATMWPLYLFQTSGGNPGSSEVWPLWVGMMCGAGYLGIPLRPVVPMRPQLRIATAESA